jgi:SOS-response transcriptional repressor LexA
VPPGGGCLRVEGNAMVPIVAEGAFVVYSGQDEAPAALEGRIVVAWVESRPLVRWFEVSGRYALLRSENPAFDPAMTLMDLEAPPDQRRVRRIIWVGTSH